MKFLKISPLSLIHQFFSNEFFLNADKVFSVCSCPKGVLSHQRFQKWSFLSKKSDHKSILDRNLGFKCPAYSVSILAGDGGGCEKGITI